MENFTTNISSVESWNDGTYLKGRGAQFNPPNRFDSFHANHEDWDGIDLPKDEKVNTQYYHDSPKTILNKVNSPDIGPSYSMNPYQGCEHGCIYCYARNTHEYYGFSAGLDFESKIIIKENAAEVLEKKLSSSRWKPMPVMLSGNTDCYQPAERRLKITRSCLEVFRKYKHPVGIITKNSLILRDLDILEDLAKNGLVHVYMSITTLDESLRQVMEPRTASAAKRLQVIDKLTNHGVPIGVMSAPIIPGLNDHEIPAILEAAAKNGATAAGYTMVCLNGAIADIFTDWIGKNFPDRADKVLSQIRECHGGKLSDSRFGVRMRGEGPMADAINGLFKMSKKRFMGDVDFPPYNMDLYRHKIDGQMSLWDPQTL